MNIFLVKNGNEILVFYNETEMKSAGYDADKIVTDEEFNSNGCYTRIINGEIVVGMTEQEKELQEYQEEIDALDAELRTLDQRYLTPRVLAGVSTGDQYTIGQVGKHENEASPLRKTREMLKIKMDTIRAAH